MTDMFRDCPECGSQRRFSQHHGEPAQCPDSADGLCPDWFCTECGTGLLIALLPATKSQGSGAAGSDAPEIAAHGKLGRVA
ncbi:MAG TPA: hypothetical protein VN840_02260 [Streptosporangiaceae bacterium]|nr:hypothetical protein [Streptosporangiaceae bacterium]